VEQLWITLPAIAPDYSGVCSAMFDLGGMSIIHDASGCTGNYTGYDEPRWYGTKSMVYCSGLREIDAVLGRDDKLIKNVLKTSEYKNPTCYSIIGSPVPMVIGSDLKGCIQSVIEKLSANSGELLLKFKYFIDKKAPISDQISPMSYECSFKSILSDYKTKQESYKFILGVKVPVTTLCPCSKEISDYGAHNQRTLVSVNVSYDRNEHIWIEDLISDIESCASCSIYPLLKREDEKFVTETAYNNPKFVEDVLRDIILKLRNNPIIKEFEIECESTESIHNHSAWAYQKEVK